MPDEIKEPTETPTETTPEPESPPAETPETPAEGTPETPAATPEDRAQLQALAQRLGLEIDDTKVTVRERAAIREQGRRLRSALEAQWTEKENEFKERETQFSDRAAKVQAIEDAYEKGDYEGLAKALGVKDWNELQNSVIQRLADPNYKRLLELEQKHKEREDREAKEKLDREEQSKRQLQEHAVTKYMQTLGQKAQTSKDPVIRAMAEDPSFLQAVYRVQQEHWDGESTVSIERALQLAPKGSRVALREELEVLYKRLHKAFGAPEPAADNGKSPKPKTQVAKRAGAEASPPGPFESDSEWRKYAVRRMEEAAERDKQEKAS